MKRFNRRKQELCIGIETVGFNVSLSNIDAVVPAGMCSCNAEMCMKIIYAGLERKCGLSEYEFIDCCNRGLVFGSVSRRQYTLSEAMRLVRLRVRDYRLRPYKYLK